MLNMIKADIYRINKNIAFYIAIAFTLLMIGVSVYMVQPGSVGQASVGDVSTTGYVNDGNGLDETIFPWKKLQSLLCTICARCR